MSKQGYGLFCPISKACEVLEPRWTLLVLVEMYCGASRFNDIKRGLPGMSPTLLSKRLKDMQGSGLVLREAKPGSKNVTYNLTEAAWNLKPIALAMGKWSEKYIETEVNVDDLDAKLLMWSLKRSLDTSVFDAVRTVVQFIFPDAIDEDRNFWLISRPESDVELCVSDPGFDVDLFVTAELKCLTNIYMGYQKLESAIAKDDLNLTGDRKLSTSISRWMGLSPLAYM